MSLQQLPALIVAPKIAVNICEACNLTGFSKTEISLAVTQKTLRAHRVEGQCIILVEDLVAFIRSKPQYIDTMPKKKVTP